MVVVSKDVVRLDVRMGWDRWGLGWLYFGLEFCFLYRGYVNVMDRFLSRVTI
jgi:hypothetical protein